MESVEKPTKNIHSGLHNSVHHVLARSYSSFFLLFIIGVFLDLIFPIKVFSTETMTEVGVVILIFGSFLIIWAQETSRNLKKHNITKETFLGGPYSFTRSPTHWGLLFLMFGFGIMINSFFVIIFTVIAFIIAKLFFLKQEEAILARKYGSPYLEYKKMIRI